MLCGWNIRELQIHRNLCTLSDCRGLECIAKKINLDCEPQYCVHYRGDQRYAIAP